jgi:ribose 5-phosphate isomerase B
MKVALGSDHAGFALKEYIRQKLEEEGKVEISDLGCYSPEVVDYPPVTLAVASAVARGEVERGILFCGNGYAMAMLANRLPGARATVCHDCYTARACREQGAANIISLGARVIGQELALELVRIWLASEFAGDRVPRYARRLAEVERLDKLLTHPAWQENLQAYLTTHVKK